MNALTFPAWFLLSFLGGISPLGEPALALAKKTKPAPRLLEPAHYRNRWKGIPDTSGLSNDHCNGTQRWDET
jgi:hypothetical protein